MEFEALLQLVADEPVFETGFLLAGAVDPAAVRVQLSRWVKAGRLYPLRRGLYALAPPYQRVKPHPFLVANRLVPGSYVTRESALAHYGLIPEHVPVTTSVTTGRPTSRNTPLGAFDFRHIRPDLFWEYTYLPLNGAQGAFVATPEKALLDMLHLRPGADNPAYLRELRLQNLERLDLDRLDHVAERTHSPKLRRAAKLVAELAHTAQDYEEL